MQTETGKKVWTEKELMALPDEGYKYELVNGELIMTPTGMEHGNIAMLIGGKLSLYAREKNLGIVCDSSTGFWMKSGNCRSPDVSFVDKERLRDLKRPPKKFFQGAPDLAVEILSPEDTVEKLHEKIIEYFENGTRLVWVVNPEDQTVLVYHTPQPDKLLRTGDELDGENVIPGFSMPVGELFAELEF